MKHPTYADRANFDHKTGLTYNPKALLEWLRTDAEDENLGQQVDPYPYASRIKPQVGRHGYDRRDGEHEPRWSLSTPEAPTENYFKWTPRNAADYRAFAKLPASESVNAS